MSNCALNSGFVPVDRSKRCHDFDDAVISNDVEDMDPTEALAKVFIKEQSESITDPPKSNLPMPAYVVMLHLVSQGYSDFTEIPIAKLVVSVAVYDKWDTVLKALKP